MANILPSAFSPFFLMFITVVGIRCGAVGEDRKVHIVYMGALPKIEDSLKPQHLSMLEEVLEDSSSSDNFVRSYKRSFNGFAAKLNEQERQKLASRQGVVSVFPSKTLQLQTTRSWDFMGFPEAVTRNLKVESDVIVGVFDTGIWPDSKSFSDEGFSPAPKKWKGACNGGKNFTCNNKVIGARIYSASGSDDSVRDIDGHGTHIASIVAGNLVPDVSFYGLAQGNARGGVPSARIAVYRVCDLVACREHDVLAAFDDAIADGVDIISISVDAGQMIGFDSNGVTIGAFHAMQNGILTSQAAGNNGPSPQTTTGLAPWILTVAASSIDRRIIDKVVLGDGTVLLGNSINSFSLNGTKPLVSGEDVSKCPPKRSASDCEYGCLDTELLKGKIVLCNEYSGGEGAGRSGALGTLISGNDENNDVSIIYPLPATHLSIHTGDMVRSYMNSTKNPEANILKSEAVNDSYAPTVASFSSRGPNYITPDILKPDVSAPGVEILAAYPPVAQPSRSVLDKRSVQYNILFGTSMACPHAAGAAAYVKSFHPHWTPSAIKSALMTTAWPMNATKNPEAEFAYGAGHIDPVKAVNPGLVYESLKDDYIKFLCNIGYDTKAVRTISGDNSSCPQGAKGEAKDLNLPSMTVHLQPDKPFLSKFSRTAKNVGSANSTYKASVTSSSKIKINVIPSVLSFKSLSEEKSFVVTVSGDGFPINSMASASLEWNDGTHSVRSPIVVHSFKTIYASK